MFASLTNLQIPTNKKPPSFPPQRVQTMAVFRPEKRDRFQEKNTTSLFVDTTSGTSMFNETNSTVALGRVLLRILLEWWCENSEPNEPKCRVGVDQIEEHREKGIRGCLRVNVYIYIAFQGTKLTYKSCFLHYPWDLIPWGGPTGAMARKPNMPSLVLEGVLFES